MYTVRKAPAVFASFFLLTLAPAFPQTLPPPSRTVFKCETDGKVVYSDSPCLGATKVDVAPTRGLNKSTGAERVGADVRREQHNEQMAEALKPIFGETPEQRAKRHHRAKLEPAVRGQCSRLDGQIADAEHKERSAAGSEVAAVQKHLLDLRSAYRHLRC